jgi:hypothetical protein
MDAPLVVESLGRVIFGRLIGDFQAVEALRQHVVDAVGALAIMRFTPRLELVDAVEDLVQPLVALGELLAQQDGAALRLDYLAVLVPPVSILRASIGSVDPIYVEVKDLTVDPVCVVRQHGLLGLG